MRQPSLQCLNGGTAEASLALVCIAVSDAQATEADRCLFFGRRRDVRVRATQAALVQLRTKALARIRA
jgi:nicotinamide mononucleotide (NMN) deamidase PncC